MKVFTVFGFGGDAMEFDVSHETAMRVHRECTIHERMANANDRRVATISFDDIYGHHHTYRSRGYCGYTIETENQ